MATTFNATGVLIRFLAALVLVLLTYNPSGYSYFHWVIHRGDTSIPLLILAGVILAIGWTVFMRATLRSLGPVGIVLALALFGCLIWLAVDFNVVSVTSQFFVYLLLIVFAAVLAIGMSWSHIRRRMSGQTDMDDVDE